MTIQTAAILMCKDETDIIDEWLQYHKPLFDIIAVYDSSTDGTFEKLQKRANKSTFLLWHDLLPHKNSRRDLLLALLEHYDFNGWVFQLDADNFLVDDPVGLAEQAGKERARTIRAKVAQFYFTDLDYQSIDKSILQRRQYYLFNWSISLAWEASPRIRWRGAFAQSPAPLGPRWRLVPVLRHYQWRSPQQAQKKLDLHYGQPGYTHLYSPKWKDYVFDHRKLHHIDEGWVGGGPRLGKMQAWRIDIDKQEKLLPAQRR